MCGLFSCAAGGILSTNPEENAFWWNANHVYVCMSVIQTILNRYTAIKTTPSRDKRFFISPKCPGSLRAQMRHLSVGIEGSFPRHKRGG